FEVVAGQTYFLKAAGFQTDAGAYDLDLTTAPAPSPVSGATFVPLNGAGARTVAGDVAVPGQVDAYYFVAPVTGRMTITEKAAAGSALDSLLSAYTGSKVLLTADDDDGGGLDSRLQIQVVAGQTYLVQATGRTYTSGGVDGITFPDRVL